MHGGQAKQLARVDVECLSQGRQRDHTNIHGAPFYLANEACREVRRLGKVRLGPLSLEALHSDVGGD